MATFPEGCEVHRSPETWVPLVALKPDNRRGKVFVFPGPSVCTTQSFHLASRLALTVKGIPWIMHEMMNAHKLLFIDSTVQAKARRILFTHKKEGLISAFPYHT
jgi:hypothetical protein